MVTKVLRCRDCKTEFIFNEGEQDFFGRNQWADPIRCPDCRRKNSLAKQKKRQQREPVARVPLGEELAKLLGGK